MTTKPSANKKEKAPPKKQEKTSVAERLRQNPPQATANLKERQHRDHLRPAGGR